MATHKVTRSASRNKSSKTSASGRANQRRTPSPYSQVRGKIVDRVEISSGDEGCAIGIMFQDRTYLSFDVEVVPAITIVPELSDWKTGNYKPLKRWPHIHSD